MLYRLSPLSLGPGPVAALTLVTRTACSLLPFKALPTIDSETPLLYPLAVSMKLMPSSIARAIIFIDSFSSAALPKTMVPRQSSETFNPDPPILTYFTKQSS